MIEAAAQPLEVATAGGGGAAASEALAVEEVVAALAVELPVSFQVPLPSLASPARKMQFTGKFK